MAGAQFADDRARGLLAPWRRRCWLDLLRHHFSDR